MSLLFALSSEVSQLLPVLVGSSVFGLTASVGQLVTDGHEPRPEACLPTRGIRAWNRHQAERRQCIRHSSIPVRIEVVDRRHGWTEKGWVVDRSVGGLGLELDRAPGVGGVLDVRPCETPGLELWVLAVVRNCLETTDCWKVGCEFVLPLPSGVLRLFG